MNLDTFAALRQKALDRLEFKALSFELKGISDDGTFEGYAAVFGNVDAYGDVIQPRAFDKTLKERPNVPILHQHDPHEVIGVSKSMTPDDHGLYVTGQLVLEVQRAREDRALMAARAISGLSIGYESIQAKSGGRGDPFVRSLQELKLWEFSPVTFPANDLAQITAVKSFVERIKTGSLEPGDLKSLLGYSEDDELTDVALLITMLEAGAAFASAEGAEGDSDEVTKMQAILADIHTLLGSELVEVGIEDVDADDPAAVMAAVRAYAEKKIETGGQRSTSALGLKEGRTLSAASRTLVEQAIEALQALLSAADGSTAEPGAAKSSKQPDEVDELTLSTARDVLHAIRRVTKE